MKHLFQIVLFSLLVSVFTFYSCKKERPGNGNQTSTSFDNPPTGNTKKPIALAGTNQTVILPTDTILLDGTASNDPDGSITGWQWIKISGPSTFVIVNPDHAATQVKNLAEGIYLFELKVTDNDGQSAKDTVLVTVNKQSSGSLVDVYVAGSEGGMAKYWKNGTPLILSNGQQSEHAVSMCISGNDVYVAGWEYIIGSGNRKIAKYWKNGIAFNLTDELSYAAANDIYVAGNDVYVVGWEADGSSTQAKYWKNGIASKPSNGWEVRSVYVSGNDVYMTGYDPDQKAKYWKNGNEVSLSTSASDYSAANGIYVSGNDVYVTGSTGEKIYYGLGYWELGTPSAVYWKNGIAVKLPDGSEANGIYVSGTDVYIAGYDYNGNNLTAKYWKNGTSIILPNGTRASSVFVYGNDVYVAGDNNGKAKYWKNGVEVSLSNGPLQSWATKIVVVSH